MGPWDSNYGILQILNREHLKLSLFLSGRQDNDTYSALRSDISVVLLMRYDLGQEKKRIIFIKETSRR